MYHTISDVTMDLYVNSLSNQSAMLDDVTNQSEPSLTNHTEYPTYPTPFGVLFYRYMFIVIYSVIFATCVIGNTLVLVVTSRSPRMKTRTNFFLANLAAADLCVGLICVLPNLFTFLYPGWLLGKAMCHVYAQHFSLQAMCKLTISPYRPCSMCKLTIAPYRPCAMCKLTISPYRLYAMCKLTYFSESFSFCASVLLLAVIAVERYIAVMHPLKARCLFTARRMHVAQAITWLLAAIYNIPLLIIFDTFTDENDDRTTFCFLKYQINMKTYYTANFICWYLIPLLVMTGVYAVISWTLWHSGNIFNKQSHDNSSEENVTKTLPMVRPDKSSMSSSSSGAGSAASGRRKSNGSIGQSSHHGCSSVAYTGYSVNGVGCNCTMYSEISERFSCNGDFQNHGEDSVVLSSAKNNPAQPTLHMEGNRLPIQWSWPTGNEANRAELNRQSRRSPHNGRGTDTHAGNTFEMTCMSGSCPQQCPSATKRQSVKKLNQAITLINGKRHRSGSRRSFHSDCASDTSSSGQTKQCDTSRNRYQATSIRVLSSRRKVIRLLVLVQITFAVCLLPHHVRLLLTYWEMYPSPTFKLSFFPPFAFICMYLNSALNPVLYSLFSESFRRSLRELVRRPWHKWRSTTTKHDYLTSKSRRTVN
ncbi:thyrotropin-releasing hormone receptor-like [Physella acuta]|uniref:thyrotropin-releasing hormone receptor-like n=1 Tax=Physella acuta TaxID=109671 RepID=UPI0027DB3609|nr:thyrotropin-releasing hormone receptor-like [Physella acuta]